MGDLSREPGAPWARLRELLAGPRPVVAPGAYDALSARLVEQAGFGVVYMTGFGSLPGLPTFDGFTDLIGLPKIRDLERRFGAP